METLIDMKTVKNIFLQSTKILILTLIASLGLSYVSAWSGPPAGGPFNCPESHVGCAGPLHVGLSTQTKKGSLTVNGNLWGGNLFTGGAGYFGGNVGIGTVSPASKLHITGGNLLIESGNVGIGNLNPSARLDVAGVVKATGLVIPTGAGLNKVLTSDASGNATWQTPATEETGGGGSTTNTQVQGGWCGYSKASTAGGNLPVHLCLGVNPFISCPAGYTRVDFTGGSDWTCIKN